MQVVPLFDGTDPGIPSCSNDSSWTDLVRRWPLPTCHIQSGTIYCWLWGTGPFGMYRMRMVWEVSSFYSHHPTGQLSVYRCTALPDNLDAGGPLHSREHIEVLFEETSPGMRQNEYGVFSDALVCIPFFFWCVSWTNILPIAIYTFFPLGRHI